MSRRYPPGDLAKNFHGKTPVDRAMFGQHRRQGHPFQGFHHQKRPDPVGHPIIQNLGDVRVADTGGDPRLFQKSVNEPTSKTLEGRVQDFYGGFFLQVDMLTEKTVATAPLPNTRKRRYRSTRSPTWGKTPTIDSYRYSAPACG